MIYPYLFSAIRKHLTTAVPALKLIEWERLQGTVQSKGELKTTPAVFIRFLPSDTEDLRDYQWTQQEFELRLITQSYRKDADKFLNADANHFQILTQIHKQLFGKAFLLSDVEGLESLVGTEEDAALTGSITRNQIDHTHSPSSLIQTSQRFTCKAYDYSTLPEFTKISKPLCIITEFEGV